MWKQAGAAPPSRDDRERLVVAPHHPDRLQRPPAPLADGSDWRFQHALLWNTFRTLELVGAGFWLRRFHLRLTGEPSVVPPQILRVHLWRALPLPPVQRIDGDRPAITADVVIETEHAVWTLLAESSHLDLADGRIAAAAVDAGCWFAGMRQHYAGVIESTASDLSLGSMLRARYSRSRESASLQSSTRGPATPAWSAWGGIRYPHLMALLQDCSEAANLPRIDRALARNALDWLASVGIRPQAPPEPPAR